MRFSPPIRCINPANRSASCNEFHRFDGKRDGEVDGVEASGMVATIIIRLESFALAKYACKKRLDAGQKTLGLEEIGLCICIPYCRNLAELLPVIESNYAHDPVGPEGGHALSVGSCVRIEDLRVCPSFKLQTQ